MALQSIGGATKLPSLDAYQVTNGPNFLTADVNADNEGYALIFQAPVTGTITGFGVCTSGAAVSDSDMDFRLETVTISATPAVPSGTLASTNTNIGVNVNAATTWFNGVFTSSYAAAAGELLACVVKRKAGGTFQGSFRTFADDGGSSTTVFPFASQNEGAGWVSMAPGNAPIFAVNYGGTYYHIGGVWPFSAATTTTFNSGSTPDVVGNIWIPRIACRVTGVWLWCDLDGGAVIKFYDTDGVTVLASATIAQHTRVGANPGILSLPLNTTVTPTVGGTYRIGVEPSSATDMSVYDFSVSAVAIMNAFALGQDMYKTTAKNPSGTGSWTNTTTDRVFLGLVVDQFDDGTGGGGSGGGPVVGGRLVA